MLYIFQISLHQNLKNYTRKYFIFYPKIVLLFVGDHQFEMEGVLFFILVYSLHQSTA